MATEREKEALATLLEFHKGNPQYALKRNWCMDGQQAQNIKLTRAKGLPQPDAGDLCMELLKHSANVQMDPNAARARPDQLLLAPYSNILAGNSNAVPNFPNIKAVLNAYVHYSKDPEVRTMHAAEVEIAFPADPARPGVPITAKLILTPGSAVDAAFTNTVLEADRGKPAPAAQTNPRDVAELVKTTNMCFTNSPKVTQGICADVGVQQAANYLANRKSSVAR